MSAHKYIGAIFCADAQSGSYDELISVVWTPIEDFVAEFNSAFDAGFIARGVQPPADYMLKRQFFDLLVEKGAILTEGDDYTGSFAKMHVASKDVVLRKHFAELEEGQRLNKLGEEAWQNALLRAARELGWKIIHEDATSNAVGIDEHAVSAMAPASDRLVPLNHNDPEYIEIRDEIEALHEEFRTSNEVCQSSDERDRIARSLDSASRLWSAAELKITQIRVGIILAVEDAIAALDKIGRASGKSILIDLIKNYVRTKSGIEF